MTRARKGVLVMLVIWSCLGWAGSALAGSGCVTGQCHAGLGRRLHPEDMACRECHQAVAMTPDGKGHRGTTAGAAAPCEGCHQEAVDHEYLHAPVAAGDCGACHDPHQNRDSMYLKEKGMQLCLGCHKDIVPAGATILHGPLAKSSCEPCHAPHGTPYASLLVKQFPSRFFVDYNERQYALCFSCHKRDLLLFADTSFYTGFRDGDRNLHYLHVNRAERGRNCKDCHAIHASGAPKLMAEEVAFGKWRLPVRFSKTDTGGSCDPGCHGPRKYDRKQAVNR